MVSHDLLQSTVTKQIVFDQRDMHSTPVFEHAMDHRCQVLVSKLETLDPSLLPNHNGLLMKRCKDSSWLTGYKDTDVQKIYQMGCLFATRDRKIYIIERTMDRL